MAHKRIVNVYLDDDGIPLLPTMKARYRNSIKQHLKKDMIDGFKPMINMDSMVGSGDGQMSSAQAQDAEDAGIKAIEDFVDIIANSVFDFCEQYMLAHFVGHIDQFHAGDKPKNQMVGHLQSRNAETYKPKGQQIIDSGLDY